MELLQTRRLGVSILAFVKSLAVPSPSIKDDTGAATSKLFVNSPWLIFLVAVGVRLIAMALIQHFALGSESAIWETGPEMVNVGASIAAHHGFSSPFGSDTGPTAWLPPVYPYLIAGIFRLAGTRSNAAGLIILTLQAVFSGLTCLTVYHLARRIFGEKFAAVAAWAWALFPYAVVVPVLFIWETSLSAMLLSIAVLLSLDLPNRKLGISITAGVIWGIAALTNTALLSIMPFALFWSFRRGSVRVLGRAALIVVGIAFLVVAPWLVRNWRTFGVLIPVRSNFGEEFWLGNHEGSTGRIAYGAGPLENKSELERYRQLGEVDYNHHRQQEATKFIAHHPAQFVRWTLYRAAYWWFGVGESAPIFFFYCALGALTIPGVVLVWPSGKAAARLLVIAVLAFPALYYVTDVYARYRHPVEPLMVILATYTVLTAISNVRRWRTSQRSS